MNFLLQTERLRLRRFRLSDVDHLFALDNDPEVMHYINGGTPTPRAVIEEQILPGFMAVDKANPAFGVWAVEEKATGAFVGWFSLRPFPQTPDQASIGYRLKRTAWSKGYATEGARALIHKGFAELGLQHIMATTYEHNLASRRVMEKVGMKLVRRFRLTLADLQSADTFHSETEEIWEGDDVEYAVTKASWEKTLDDIR